MEQGSPTAKDPRIDVVLAEFNALRSEMTTRITIQATILGTGLSGIGVIVSFAIAKDGSRSLLVLVPITSAIVLLLYANESYRSVVLGDHVARQFTYLRRILNDQRLPSWEHAIQTNFLKPTRWIQGSLDGMLDAALIAASVTSLIFARDAAQWLYWVGGSMLLVAAGVRLWIGARGPLPGKFSRSRRKGLGPVEEESLPSTAASQARTGR